MEKNTPFWCSLCKKGFFCKSNLNRHNKRKHSEKPQYFDCDLCKKSYKQKISLIVHMRQEHFTEKDRKIECPKCDKKFSYKESFKRHIQNIHSDNNKKRKREVDKKIENSSKKSKKNVSNFYYSFDLRQTNIKIIYRLYLIQLLVRQTKQKK